MKTKKTKKIKYTKKDYEKYRQEIIKSFGKDISITFDEWRKFAPISNKAISVITKSLLKMRNKN
jgi:hypothetical protein